MAPEALFFRGMPTEPDEFLKPPGVSGLQPSTQTHLKRPCATHVLSVGRTTKTDTGTHFGRSCWLVYGSVRVCPGYSGNRLRPSVMDAGKPTSMLGAPRPASSSLIGPSPQALTLLEGDRFIARHLRCPLLGECSQDSRYFCARQVVWAMALHLDPSKIRACETLVHSTNIDSTDTVYRIRHDCLLCLIIYYKENYFYFLFNGVRDMRSPMGVEHSGEGIFGRRSHNAKALRKNWALL